MAASDLKFKRTMVDKISIRGILSEDGTYITYYDENKNVQDISIKDILHPFEDQLIDISVSLKTEEDLCFID